MATFDLSTYSEVPVQRPIYPIILPDGVLPSLQNPTLHQSEPIREVPTNQDIAMLPQRPSVAMRLSTPIPVVKPVLNSDRVTPRLPCRLPAQQWTSCNADGCYHRGKCPSYKGTQLRAETILPLPPLYSSFDLWLRGTIGHHIGSIDDNE